MHALAGLLWVVAAVGGAGCESYRRDISVMQLTASGDLGRARISAASHSTRDRSDRNYILDRMKVMHLALGDGVPEAAASAAAEVYDFLRTQGVNAQNTLPSVFFGEGATRVWKGEPFEQAMALANVAIIDGVRGDWGNVRAAANNALFQVRDFSKVLDQPSSSVSPFARSQSRGSSQASGPDDVAQKERLIAHAERTGDNTLEAGVTPVASDFELGYMLKLIAARQLRSGEEQETAALLDKIAPQISQLTQLLRTGTYNTVFVVDYGFAPQKYATGPDGAIAAFRPTSPRFGGLGPSDANGPLHVRTPDTTADFGVVTDLNRLARDLRWNNLEDLRLAKSQIGSGLIIAGATTAGVSRDRTTQLVGLGLILAGALSKSTAQADTRAMELFPQRTYVVALNLRSPTNRVEFSLPGEPSASLVLPAVPGGFPGTESVSGTVRLHHIRLPATPGPWATSGQILYANDATGPATSANYPWILGGRSVQTPTQEVLSAYQRDGYLLGISLDTLIDLYRAEGITIAGSPPEGAIGLHVLEGGSWLFTPRPASTGFVRLFCADHPAYVPKSPRVRELADQIRQQQRSSPPRPTSP